MDLCIQEDEIELFLSLLLSASLSTTKTLHVVLKKKKHKKILKSGKEKADQPGTLGPKEQHDSEFPEFPFCLTYPRRVAAEIRHLAVPIGTDHGSPNNSLLSFQRPGSLSRMETLDLSLIHI